MGTIKLIEYLMAQLMGHETSSSFIIIFFIFFFMTNGVVFMVPFLYEVNKQLQMR